MRPHAGYLFDLDGTLVDTAPDIHIALNVALESHNLAPATQTHTRHWIGHGARALIEQALNHESGAAATDDHINSIRDVFISHYQDHIADVSRPYPGVVETLDVLTARGARLAVVTNKMTSLTLRLLDALELSRHFQSIVCGDTTSQPKPAADPAQHACAELGLAPPQTLFVGDSAADVSCARAAGCPIVCVRDGYNHGVPAAELGADSVIESFTDLV